MKSKNVLNVCKILLMWDQIKFGSFQPQSCGYKMRERGKERERRKKGVNERGRDNDRRRVNQSKWERERVNDIKLHVQMLFNCRAWKKSYSYLKFAFYFFSFLRERKLPWPSEYKTKNSHFWALLQQTNKFKIAIKPITSPLRWLQHTFLHF